MARNALPRSFYARPAAEVARALLGCVIRFGPHAGMIREAEAYLPAGDEAAHAWRGRTARTAVLFGPPGHVYVFLCYGVHHCLNVSCEPEGVPGCVLIRAVDGWGDGPGKLTRHAGITLDLNGADLTRGPLTIHPGSGSAGPVRVTPRIGIRRSRDLPLRFVLE
jgi:DNA-3-methyladenine glycosylase